MSLFSIIIPIYRNELNIPPLLSKLAELMRDRGSNTEVVFVIDGSPDQSLAVLAQLLPGMPFTSRVVTLSRNFGSFNAIRAGLAAATGDLFGVIAADLQEPPEILFEFATLLRSQQCDVCVGTRATRDDDLSTRIFSTTFWHCYRAFVQRSMPVGGLDIFGCNKKVRDVLLSLTEANSSLVGQLIWVGFRRINVPYHRQARIIGKSGWTFRRKWKYMADSIFSFTDLPIRALTAVGLSGALLVIAVSASVLALKVAGGIDVPGYTAIMLAILFVGFTNFFAMGIVGNYVWRCFENSKQRPLHIPMSVDDFVGTGTTL